MNVYVHKQLMIGNLMACHLEELADELDRKEGHNPFRRERSLSNLWERSYRDWWNTEGRDGRSASRLSPETEHSGSEK